MRSRMAGCSIGVLVGLMLLLPHPAAAQSLISVMTSDSLDKGQLGMDLAYNGAWRAADPTSLSLVTLQYGITSQLTMGVDALVTAGGVFMPNIRPNMIYVVGNQENGLSGAIGYQNIGVRSFGEQPAIVLSERLKRLKLHAGYTYEPDGAAHRVMLGVEVPLHPRVTG